MSATEARSTSAPVANGSGTAGQGVLDVRLLEPGKPIARELAGGQSHSYQLAQPRVPLLERTVSLRPYPSVKLFRDSMYASLKDKLPAEVWDYSTPEAALTRP